MLCTRSMREGCVLNRPLSGREGSRPGGGCGGGYGGGCASNTSSLSPTHLLKAGAKGRLATIRRLQEDFQKRRFCRTLPRVCDIVCGYSRLPRLLLRLVRHSEADASRRGCWSDPVLPPRLRRTCPSAPGCCPTRLTPSEDAR